MDLCPCHSGKEYSLCCQPLHLGAFAENALDLMRSRFSAYALDLPQYIIKTTHPNNPQFNSDFLTWSKEISLFSQNTQFMDLQILDFQESDNSATVTFIAHLTPSASFQETSLFQKHNNMWLYLKGIVKPVKY